ncbi:hypothetical protein D5H75_17105 [Bailinhaonella thermotolerans]|uniref:Uncharacterized protein n=1 Tax=Bailinhaonella thermotolerans TaxID=1070861 RepID=A0A3A4ASD6_9ACTN|nr:hypothetical protein D5H75_17105 [Bailinhaonella thermotolerans]
MTLPRAVAEAWAWESLGSGVMEYMTARSTPTATKPMVKTATRIFQEGTNRRQPVFLGFSSSSNPWEPSKRPSPSSPPPPPRPRRPRPPRPPWPPPGPAGPPGPPAARRPPGSRMPPIAIVSDGSPKTAPVSCSRARRPGRSPPPGARRRPSGRRPSSRRLARPSADPPSAGRVSLAARSPSVRPWRPESERPGYSSRPRFVL